MQTHTPEFVAGIGTLALINAGLAQTKNRSGLAWFAVSLFLGPIATLLIVALDKASGGGQVPMRPAPAAWRRWWLGVGAGVLAATGFAGVTELRRPGWPTADYAVLAAGVHEAAGAVIEYQDGSMAFVTDPRWLGQVGRLLTSAPAQPDVYCFCLNYPRVTFLTARSADLHFEVAHATKVRFTSPAGGGDFIVGAAVATELRGLLLAQRAHAYRPPTKLPSVPPYHWPVDLTPPALPGVGKSPGR